MFGPAVEPRHRIKGYSEDEFENFIREWAFYHEQVLQKKYVTVGKFGGSGDMGRDVVGYIDPPSTGGRLDIFQCKRYNHALYPGDVWVELGKLCYYTCEGAFTVPEQYRFVAPEDAGAELGRLLEKPDELRQRLMDEWEKHVEGEIIRKHKIKLEGKLLDHVQKFDFGLVSCKPMEEILNELKKTVRYAPRFGGGLNLPRPPDPVPPDAIQPDEQRYVDQLIEAYKDHHDDDSLCLATLAANVKLFRHLYRSRERYFCAELIKQTVRDNLPVGVTFEQVQEQVFDTVIDIAEAEHESGLVRVDAVTGQAALYQLQNHPLRPYMKSKILMGICHQFANVDRLKWVQE